MEVIDVTNSVYLFGRDAVDTAGEHYSQSAVVFADGASEAQDLLIGVLDGIGETSEVFAGGPDWQVEEIGLDVPKVISLASTRWPAV
jgi:hypothetical protein